jgi:hypothetical protein
MLQDLQMSCAGALSGQVIKHSLAHWIIAATAAEDGKLQEYARKLTVVRKAWGLCPVTVFGWGDIDTPLCKQLNLDVTRHFYPSHFENIIPSSKFHVPQAFQLSDYFSDPLNHLQTLRKQLQAQGEAAVLAKASVQGMGGVGKTQLALKYSHDFRESYAGVWWFSAETQGGLESDCLLFCEKQGIPVAQNESPGSAARVGGSGRETLLILNLVGEQQEPKNWPRCKALLPHVVYMDDNYEEKWFVVGHLGWLLNQLAVYLQYGPALYQTALPLFQRVLAIAEKKLGPAHPNSIKCRANLAGLQAKMK